MDKNTLSPFLLSPFLRRVFAADALLCIVTGLLFWLGAGLLENLLQLPAALLRPLGMFLVPYGALIALLATRTHAPRWAMWAAIIVNMLWAVDSFVLLASGWVQPNALGTAFVIFQAVVVAGFALLQYMGLRQQVAIA